MLGMAGVTLSHLLVSDAGPVKGSRPSRAPQVPFRFPCLHFPELGGLGWLQDMASAQCYTRSVLLLVPKPRGPAPLVIAPWGDIHQVHSHCLFLVLHLSLVWRNTP